MALYKSAFSGEQIDEAIGTVRSKEATWDGKADAVHEHVIANITDLRISNDNLLDNWYWRQPVNQRGQTTYAGSGYTIDRWTITGATLSAELKSDCIRLFKNSASANPAFMQALESELLVGKTVTATIKYRGNFSGNIRFTAGGGANPSLPPTTDTVNWQYFTFNYTVVLGTFGPFSNKVLFGIQLTSATPTTEYIEIEAVKLEVGSISTLANDPPANYGEELAKCKRFYRLWTDSTARTEALKEVGLMRLASPTTGTININSVTYHYASADM